MTSMKSLGKLTLQVAAGAMVLGALAGTCGVSTVRGMRGNNLAAERMDTMASAIKQSKLDPDCISSNDRVSERLASSLRVPEDKRAEFKLGMSKIVGMYREELAKASTEEERREAGRKLAYWLDGSFLLISEATATENERRDRWYTFATIFGPGEASTLGSRNAVFGDRANRCVEIIMQECGTQ